MKDLTGRRQLMIMRISYRHDGELIALLTTLMCDCSLEAGGKVNHEYRMDAEICSSSFFFYQYFSLLSSPFSSGYYFLLMIFFPNTYSPKRKAHSLWLADDMTPFNPKSRFVIYDISKWLSKVMLRLLLLLLLLVMVMVWLMWIFTWKALQTDTTPQKSYKYEGLQDVLFLLTRNQRAIHFH